MSAPLRLLPKPSKRGTRRKTVSRRTQVEVEFIDFLSESIYNFVEALNFEPTWQQRQLFDAVDRGDKKIAVKSGQGPGKSCASAIVGMWKCLCFERQKLVVTAPTMSQIKEVHLGEAQKLLMREGVHPRLKGYFSFLDRSYGVHGYKAAIWGCLGKAATTTEATQGQHSELGMSVIAEEVSGVPAEIMVQYEGTLSGEDSLYLVIGNPNKPSGYFFDIFTKFEGWTKLTWNGEETPKSKWFNPERNEQLAREYGKDSNTYKVRVKGEFPDGNANTLFTMQDLVACSDPSRRIEFALKRNEDGEIVKQLSMDYARFGGDECVGTAVQGSAVIKYRHWANVEPGDVQEAVMKWQTGLMWRDDECVYIPDATGIGQGCMGELYEEGKYVHEFHNGGRAYEDDKFADQITEAYHHLAQKVKARSVYIPRDHLMFEQLVRREYGFDNNGLIKLESKKDYKRRMMKEGQEELATNSPDRADSICMAFYPHASARMHTSSPGDYLDSEEEGSLDLDSIGMTDY